MAKMKRIPKSDYGPARWETMSRDTRKKKTQPWCAFYTPQGRMVSKPAGKRPRHMHPEDFCADKTPFKGRVIRSY